LPAHAVVHDVFSPVSLKDTTAPPAPKPPREKDFRHVYTHRQKVPASEQIPAASSQVEGPPPQPSVPSSDFDVPIVLCKGKWSCTNHPISHFGSYDRLTPLRHIVLSLSFVSLPRSYKEAILIPAWKQAMDEKIDALISRGTWELVSAPKDNIVGCRWLYTLNYRPNGSVDRYKVRLAAKGYTQTYGVDYFETFHRLSISFGKLLG